MTNSKLMLMLSLVASTLYFSNSMAANVTKLSGESFEQIGKGAFWVVSVSCDDSNGDRIVQRNADADAWCPKGDDSLCSDDKTVAAKNACSDAYTAQSEAIAKQKAQAQEQQRQQQLAATREKQAAEQAIQDAELALQAKISIEEELIAIEQKRLELTETELKIDRRIMEIDDILKTEGDEEEDEI